jgi:hypothetical protein
MASIWRITLTVDNGWLNAINEMTSYVDEDEVCFWESVQGPFEVDAAKYSMTEEEYLAILNEGE